MEFIRSEKSEREINREIGKSILRLLNILQFYFILFMLCLHPLDLIFRIRCLFDARLNLLFNSISLSFVAIKQAYERIFLEVHRYVCMCPLVQCEIFVRLEPCHEYLKFMLYGVVMHKCTHTHTNDICDEEFIRCFAIYKSFSIL